MSTLLETCSLLVLSRFGLAMTRTELLLEFFDCEINRGVEIGFAIFSEEVITTNTDTDTALELFFRRMRDVIFFKSNSGIDKPAVDMLQFVDLMEDVLFDRLSESDIVCRKNELHDPLNVNGARGVINTSIETFC